MVSSLHLCIKVEDQEELVPLRLRKVTLPFRDSRKLSDICHFTDDQSELSFKLFQGQNMNDLTQVRHCKITGIPKDKAGVEIYAHFEEDVQGIISVRAGYQVLAEKYAEIPIPVSNVGQQLDPQLRFYEIKR